MRVQVGYMREGHSAKRLIRRTEGKQQVVVYNLGGLPKPTNNFHTKQPVASYLLLTAQVHFHLHELMFLRAISDVNILYHIKYSEFIA